MTKRNKKKVNKRHSIEVFRFVFRLMPNFILAWGGKKMPNKMKKKMNKYVYPYQPINLKSIVLAMIRYFPEKTQSKIIHYGYQYYHRIQIKNFLLRRRHKKLLMKILSKNAKKKVIIYPPIIDWSWMKQRPHHIMKALADKDYLVFWCTNNLREDKVSGFEKIDDNLYLCSDINLLIKNVKRPFFFTSSVEHNHWIKAANSPKIIYDYLDDLGVYVSGEDNHLIQEHNYLIKNAALVVTTADMLADQVKKVRADYLLVPNAADPAFFALTKKPPVPEDIEPLLGKPIIGYYGALAKWFDFDVLKAAASKLKGYNFVLLGPDYDNEMRKHHLDKVSNIHWLGLKKYDELPAYLYFFDVAILPFIKSKVTDSVSPVKVFEYMSGGKPIVTTDMHECRKYKSILVAKNSGDFISKISLALKLKNDKKYRTLLSKEAKENSWLVRSTKIAKAIEKIK